MTQFRRVLITQSADSQGLVAKITTICYQHKLNITNNSEYVDNLNNRFFMRTELEGTIDETALLADLAAELPGDSSQHLVPQAKKKLVILATKEPHCLGELLLKSHYDALDVDILAVVSNHRVLQDLAEKFSVPFFYFDHQDLSREAHEQQLIECLDQFSFDYIVLAKYMRVLTPTFVDHYANKIINIHHSFLPAFIGSKPYHQAHQRGVKIIGATAHFVNSDLDQGPIISQDVVHITHRHSAEEMVKAGREVEESVLTGALRKVIEDKVIVYGNRTVVFD